MVEGAILLVRADAGPQIGSGHFMRCLALAQAWQEQGATAIFLMAPGAETLGNRLKHDNIREVRLSSQPGSLADAKETSESALRLQATWVALDGYQFSPNYQRALKDTTGHLLLFDDLGHADRYYADLLLNQNAYATPEMYDNRAGDSTLLLGADYLLLRHEFREWTRRDRQIASCARNLLITFGGSDAENATGGVLQALAMLRASPMNVRVLVGASNPHRDGLERLAAKLPHSVEFETDTQRIAHEMAWADLAISAAGSTSWELAFMGLPSLLGYARGEPARLRPILALPRHRCQSGLATQSATGRNRRRSERPCGGPGEAQRDELSRPRTDRRTRRSPGRRGHGQHRQRQRPNTTNTPLRATK